MDEWNKGLVAHLGIRIVEVTPERVVGELDVRDELKTTTAALGFKTATLESKTNFFAAATGGRIRAEATPLHKGRSTTVWQTRVTDESGRLLSLTIQTQAVLRK